MDEQDQIHSEVFQEVSSIRNDPSNPKHEGFKRGDKAVTDYIDSLYARIPGGDQKIDFTIDIGKTPAAKGQTEEPPAQEIVDMEALRQRWGDAYEQNLTAAQSTIRTFLGGMDESSRAAFISRVESLPQDKQGTLLDLAVQMGLK